MSARDHWQTVDLWRNWHYWRARARKFRDHYKRNQAAMCCQENWRVLASRRPGLVNPDAHARVAVEGASSSFKRSTEVRV